MKFPLLSLPTLLAGLFAFSTPGVATNLIGDVILGSYNVPCAAATCNAFDQYEYSVNPFTVEAVSQETNLNIIAGDLNTGVDFGASSVVFTFQQDTTWNPFPFNGPEFAVVSGNPFGTVVGVTSPVGEPVDAYVSGGVLFVNWQGDSFKTGDMVTVAFGAPEPSTWAMMLLGFACLGYAGYRGRRIATGSRVGGSNRGGNMKALFGLVLASALTLPTVGAMANVVYSLNETVIGSDRFVGTLTLPDFISTDTTFPVSDFSVSINAFPWTTVEFKPNTSSLTCSVDFGLSSCDFLSLTNGLGSSDFYGYTPGTFGKVGTNTSTNGALSLELTVSQTSVVPEPPTWAMMLLGFAGLGYAGYREHRSVAAVL